MKKLISDIKRRWLRTLSVAALSIVVFMTFMSQNDASWMLAINLLSLLAIVVIIATDKDTNINHTKSTMYITVIGIAIWLLTLVNTFIHPPTVLFEFSTGGQGDSVMLTFATAPIVLISALLILVLVIGQIDYKLKQRSKPKKNKK